MSDGYYSPISIHKSPYGLFEGTFGEFNEFLQKMEERQKPKLSLEELKQQEPYFTQRRKELEKQQVKKPPPKVENYLTLEEMEQEATLIQKRLFDYQLDSSDTNYDKLMEVLK